MDSSSGAAGRSSLVYLLPLIAKPWLDSSSAAASPSWIPLALALLCVFAASAILFWCFPGGPAWGRSLIFSKKMKNAAAIPGPRGFPVLGSLLDMGALAHRRLAALARSHSAERLMAVSVGSTRMVVSSLPDVARQILASPCFADRPLKQSAQELLFGRAMGFAPYGDYWRRLRRIASGCLFSPRRIAAQEPLRQAETAAMVADISGSAARSNGGGIAVRGFVQRASLNSVMRSVFGRRIGDGEEEVQAMVREGFELLGAFNWSDHLPFLRQWDPQGVVKRCQQLVPRVNAFVRKIIQERRAEMAAAEEENSSSSKAAGGGEDFVHVLLSLQGEDKLEESDMIAVLWEMIFRGTDTTAILTEWALAELVLNPDVQRKLQSEIDSVCPAGQPVRDSDTERMPYLQAVINETLRLHPPGPLLSWARLATHDVEISGYHVPAGTSAMVNMWAITHDPSIWPNPEAFDPERFVENKSFDVRGIDLRLAPFGAGRRVCPGRALGLATVKLWIARLVQEFSWMPCEDSPVDLSEVLKLSCEMVNPLKARPVSRRPAATH
ncbi:cytochrome P450 78A4 [Selaginella moellendorffii]|nr:cytochrome P450 78A4 [Selaginella moellendorffii]|eukprot:XP_002985246.2 cytochrome P450 78A4 [Selaginella moellendorffii]